MSATKTERQQDVQEDIRDCEVIDVGVEGFAECPCEGPNTCEYALPFGYAFLCKHPKVNRMLENTKVACAEVKLH